MKRYAIDIKEVGSSYFEFSGIHVHAARESKAIRKAERMFPKCQIRARLVGEEVQLQKLRKEI